jgi:hypothetical protein
MQQPITLQSSTLRAANSVVVPWASIVVGHSAAAARLERQSRLRAIERLDLALLANRKRHRVRRRIEIEADDIGHLGGELRVARALERGHPVRLQILRRPDALHRAERNAGGPPHRPAGPVRRLVRRSGAGLRGYTNRPERAGLSR